MLLAGPLSPRVPHRHRAAAAIAGVHRIVTAADIRTVIAEPYYGPAFHDQPILAEGKVRHVGEPVAAVLAADPHIAEQAAQAIEVDYEPMAAVFDEVEALSIALDFHLRRGDPAKAFANAEQVFEHTFRTQQTQPAQSAQRQPGVEALFARSFVFGLGQRQQ
jgi:CO/xanthine dehydrogenase Mo-binding subunit